MPVITLPLRGGKRKRRRGRRKGEGESKVREDRRGEEESRREEKMGLAQIVYTQASHYIHYPAIIEHTL